MTAARIVFSALLVYAVCTAAGQILLARLKLQLDRAEARFLAFVTGSACVSALVFLLAALRRVYPGVLLALSAAVLVARVVLVRKDSIATRAEPSLDRRWMFAFWTAYIVFGIYYLCNAMAPETSSDGVLYHAGLAARYFERHGFFPMRTNMYANLPGGAEMLSLFAYSFGRHSAVAAVHLLFLLAMPFGMMAYARRMGQPLAGIAGALLFYAAPVVGKDGSIAYNDVCTAAIVFGCFYAVQIWYQDRAPAALIPAGLLAGFAFACKYTAFTAILYAGGFVLIACLRRRQKAWLPLAVIALTIAPMVLPWMIKNGVYVGNPVFPFFGRIFSDRYFAARHEQDLHTFYGHPNGVTYAQVPWEVTTGGKLDGVLGPVFLLAPLALLSLRSSMGRHLLAAFAVTMLAYPGNLGTRFLIPPLPFLALALASALAARPAAMAAVTAVHLILSWPSLIPAWSPRYQWRLEEFDWRAALRLTPEEQYLAAHVPDYRAGLMLDRFVPRGRLVYAPSLGQIAYHNTETIGTNLQLRVLDTIAAGFMPGADTILRRRFSFPPVRTQTVRLVLAGRGDLPWRLQEVRFFHGTAEWPRDPRWRVTASSNRWDIGLAFDNNPISAWASSRRAEAGLWIQVDFGSPLDLTAISTAQPADQRHLPQTVEEIGDGAFHPIAAHVSEEESPYGPGLRRAAAAAIKASGVEWLLLRTGDYGDEDFRLRAPYWDAREIAREGDYRLWKLGD